MPGVLALSPLALVIVLLAVRVPTWISAAAGLLGSIVCALLAFPTPLAVFAAAGTDYFPLVVEVALILLFGMMLASILEASGAMRALSGWVEATVPSRSIGVALVVFGIVPFAESVTGFGIGVTIGVPVLRHLGCSIRHSALFGLLGLVAVPWGALGPGTTVAAALADLDVDALGLTTAWINAIPIAVVLVAIIVLARPKPLSALGMATAAGLLWAGILASNALLGMAPAGIVGSLLVIAGIGLPLSIRSRFAGMDRRLGRAVLPYATLTVGILLARELYALVPSPLTDIVSSPPFWLAVACLVAVLVARGRGRARGASAGPADTPGPGPADTPGPGPTDAEAGETADAGDSGTDPDPAVALAKEPLRPVAASAVRAWVPIGAATAAFMVMGWVMTTSGMSDAIGALVPAGLLLVTPWLTTVGAVLTGSNTGSNAMFSGTLASAADAAGAPAMTVVAAGNVAGSFAALAAPPRVAMSVQLSGGTGADPRDGLWVLGRAALIVAINALAVGLWLQFLG
ncbi:L-lactate permease [Brevibacterium casei]|uniref:L-lactate permease n=1 Tax=Brevibacterium casei TaxID=33889 RepID=A0AB34XTF5_9MICO|nr:L-lactate permease [Brevibacterium casei]KZE19029.1 L-lactate permease [Brevibacterium casei]